MDDEGAFREFVTARLGALSRVAYLLAGDHHGAEDLVQCTLVKLARHWRRVSAADQPDAYVRRIMYHEHVSSGGGTGASRPRWAPSRTPPRRISPRRPYGGWCCARHWPG